MLFTTVSLLTAALAIPAYDMDLFQMGERRFVNLDGGRFACFQLNQDQTQNMMQNQDMTSMHQAMMNPHSMMNPRSTVQKNPDVETRLPPTDQLIRVGDQIVRCQQVMQIPTTQTIGNQLRLNDVRNENRQFGLNEQTKYASASLPVSNQAETNRGDFTSLKGQLYSKELVSDYGKQFQLTNQDLGTDSDETMAYTRLRKEGKATECAKEMDKSCASTSACTRRKTQEREQECAKENDKESERDVKIEHECSIEFKSEKLKEMLDNQAKEPQSPELDPSELTNMEVCNQ